MTYGGMRIPAESECDWCIEETPPVEMGCVHEHVGVVRDCGRHMHQTTPGQLLCVQCAMSAEPHLCPLHGGFG